MAATTSASADGAMRSKGQLRDFLKFFATKREVFDSELRALFRDVEDARLGEAMFSVDDVRSILEDAQLGVADAAAKELEKHANMAGLVLEQVFAGAIIGGVELAIDLSRTEDADALRRVSKLKLLDQAELDATKRSAAGKLDSMRSEHLRLMARVSELEKSLGDKVEEMAKAGAEMDRMRAERGDLVRRLETAETAVASSPATPSGADSAASASASGAIAAERDSLRALNAAIQTELEDAKAEIKALHEASAAAGGGTESQSTTAAAGTGAATTASGSSAHAPRVTKQFQRMREMLKAKTEQVKQLRTRLSKYEPDDVKTLSEADETPLVPKMA